MEFDADVVDDVEFVMIFPFVDAEIVPQIC